MAGVLEQREDAYLGAGHADQLQQCLEVKVGVEPVRVGEQQVPGQDQIKGPVLERQVGQCARDVPLRVCRDVSGEHLGGGLTRLVVAGDVREVAPDVPVGIAGHVGVASISLVAGKHRQLSRRPLVDDVDGDRVPARSAHLRGETGGAARAVQHLAAQVGLV